MNFNIDDAKLYIETLTGSPDTEMLFQTFPDSKAFSDWGLTKVFQGSFDKYKNTLIAMNKKGAGVFVTVNENQGTRRSKRNIVRVRAVFADSDDGPIDDVSIIPSMAVSSKNGEHLYLVLNEDIPLESFERAQKNLAYHLKTDSKISDLARVMRLPGFYHQKAPHDPYLVKIISSYGYKYSLLDIYDVYPPYQLTEGVEGNR